MAILDVVPAIGGPAGAQAVQVDLDGGATGVTGVTFGGTAATSVVVLDDFTITCVTPAHAPGLVTVATNLGASLANAYTFDVFDWTDTTLAATHDFRDSIYVSGHGFTFVGDTGAIWQSPTGAQGTWTQRTCPAPGTQAWKSIAYAPAASGLGSGNGRYVIVGNAGVVAYSDDTGVTWTAASAAEANSLRGVAWSPTALTFCLVSSNGVHRAQTSADGITWATQTAASARSWVTVRWSVANSLFVALASTTSIVDAIMTSPTGGTWTSQTTTSYGAVVSGGFVADSEVYTGQTCYLSGGFAAANLAHSTNETAWSSNATGSTSSSERLIDMPSAGLLFAATNRLTSLRSSDGVTWASVTVESPVTAGGDNCACWADDLGVVVLSRLGAPADMLRGVLYVVPSSVTGISPARGTIRGGTVCTITGTFLTGVVTGDVLFGSTAATDVVAAADGLSVTCIAPAHASGAVDVVVTGIGTLTAAYTYVTVTRVTPNSGTTFGGTAVTITGAGFSLATGVTFDGVTATSIVYVSDTSITCVTPLHASGAVTVAVAGVDTLANGYTYALPVSLLPPYPYYAPMVQDGTSPGGLTSTAWANWWNVVKARIESLPGSVSAESVIGVLSASQIPTLPWSRISKTGASVADLQYPGVGANGQYLGISGGVPVWRTFGATSAPTNFDPGTSTIGAAQFMAFPGYIKLAVGEALTMGVGAVLRVF